MKYSQVTSWCDRTILLLHRINHWLHQNNKIEIYISSLFKWRNIAINLTTENILQQQYTWIHAVAYRTSLLDWRVSACGSYQGHPKKFTNNIKIKKANKFFKKERKIYIIHICTHISQWCTQRGWLLCAHVASGLSLLKSDRDVRGLSNLRCQWYYIWCIKGNQEVVLDFFCATYRWRRRSNSKHDKNA